MNNRPDLEAIRALVTVTPAIRTVDPDTVAGREVMATSDRIAVLDADTLEAWIKVAHTVPELLRYVRELEAENARLREQLDEAEKAICIAGDMSGSRIFDLQAHCAHTLAHIAALKEGK